MLEYELLGGENWMHREYYNVGAYETGTVDDTTFWQEDGKAGFYIVDTYRWIV